MPTAAGSTRAPLQSRSSWWRQNLAREHTLPPVVSHVRAIFGSGFPETRVVSAPRGPHCAAPPDKCQPPHPPRTFCTCGFPPIPRGVTLPVPSPPPHTLVPSLTAPPTLISPVPSPPKRRHAQVEHLHTQPRPRPLLLLTPASPLLSPGTALAVSPTPLWGWEPRRGLSARGCEHTRDAQHGGSPQNRGWWCWGRKEREREETQLGGEERGRE